MDRRSRDGESTLCVSRSWERRGRCRRRLILRASRAIRMRETTGEGENGIEAITRHINHLSTNDPLGSAHQVLLDSTREYRSSLSEDCCDQEVPELFEYQKRLLANVQRVAGRTLRYAARSYSLAYRALNCRLVDVMTPPFAGFPLDVNSSRREYILPAPITMRNRCPSPEVAYTRTVAVRFRT